MQDDIVETYPDVLQNIELAIVKAYELDPSLLDLDVMDGLDAIIRRYGAEAQGRVPPRLSLSERAGAVSAFVESMCEWRLGRTSLGGEDGAPAVDAPDPIDPEALLACLKRVRKSVRFWNEKAGRQGYLEYVVQFMEHG